MKITNCISPRGCFSGACPSIIETDENVILIQGVRLGKEDKTGLVIPGHEDVVGIPKAVFEDLLSQYRR